jgi:hypothetical protein
MGDLMNNHVMSDSGPNGPVPNGPVPNGPVPAQCASVVTVTIPRTRTMIVRIATWTPRQRWAGVMGAIVVALGIGLPTDVIPNPVFGRPVPVTWWSYPVLIVTSVLAGLLIATYVRATPPAFASTVGEISSQSSTPPAENELLSRTGSLGGLLSFFAVGCPVCNKLVVLALGTSGARQWFEPVQPVLAVGSIVLLAYALRIRLNDSCQTSSGPRLWNSSRSRLGS